MRKAGKFIVLDDCDGIVTDETGLNLLKAATDPTFRQVGWSSTRDLRNPTNGKLLPNQFDFNGTVIICTNVRLTTGRSRIANHMDALRSRSVPFSLALESREDQYAQIFHMIVEKDYLKVDAATALDDIEKVDLFEADIEGINLADSPLNEAYMPYANLSYANLQNSEIVAAELGDIRLYQANLSNANLKGTNLSRANLRYANLQGANLSNVNLQGADLYNANLSNTNLRSADLSGANLEQAKLSNAELSGCNLFRAKMADLSEAKCDRTTIGPEGY
jgi:uncharacterized protein YjbI with pentapeptide repeats